MVELIALFVAGTAFGYQYGWVIGLGVAAALYCVMPYKYVKRGEQ